MATKIQQKKWDLHTYKRKKLLLWGLKNGYITPYGDVLIEKLRTIYDGGIPASIILLSDGLTNGNCYERALLMSRAFLDEEDVRLLYASIDSLKLNPLYVDREDPLYADHCVVEITTKNREHIIYDTSSGFAYDKKIYWLMEHPKIRRIDDKKTIMEMLKLEEYYHPENLEKDEYAAPLILPMIEMTYGRPTEMYSYSGIELLQREIEHFKKEIDYDAICQEIEEDMRRVGFK